MNAAVLMFTACLAGQGPAPMPYAPAPGGYAPAPVVAYPNQGYGHAAPGNGHGHCFGCGFGSAGNACGSHGHCFGLHWGGHGFGHGGNNCCGKATVDCCGEDKCCLLKKIKDKICCYKIRITCEKKPSCCDHGPRCHQPCPQPCHQPCPQPACHQPCPPKPVCCPKPACEKVEPTCHTPCTKICWTPGYCLHKCKEKLKNLCGDKGGHECHGGCGTAATPNACGSTVIAPAPGAMIPPAAGTPVNPGPTPAPKAMPDAKKLQSSYGPVRPELQPVAGTAPRVIDLTPSPF